MEKEKDKESLVRGEPGKNSARAEVGLHRFKVSFDSTEKYLSSVPLYMSQVQATIAKTSPKVAVVFETKKLTLGDILISLVDEETREDRPLMVLEVKQKNDFRNNLTRAHRHFRSQLDAMLRIQETHGIAPYLVVCGGTGELTESELRASITTCLKLAFPTIHIHTIDDLPSVMVCLLRQYLAGEGREGKGRPSFASIEGYNVEARRHKATSPPALLRLLLEDVGRLRKTTIEEILRNCASVGRLVDMLRNDEPLFAKSATSKHSARLRGLIFHAEIPVTTPLQKPKKSVVQSAAAVTMAVEAAQSNLAGSSKARAKNGGGGVVGKAKAKFKTKNERLWPESGKK